MTALWAWLIRLFGGFAIWEPAKLGKVIFVGLIALGVFLGAWKFMQRTTSNVQNNDIASGGTMSDIDIHQPKVMFGCMRMPTAYEKTLNK